MFETLSQGFRSARLKLQGKTQLTEDNISAALREVRLSLLEADVELGGVTTFLARSPAKAWCMEGARCRVVPGKVHLSEDAAAVYRALAVINVVCLVVVRATFSVHLVIFTRGV